MTGIIDILFSIFFLMFLLFAIIVFLGATVGILYLAIREIRNFLRER